MSAAPTGPPVVAKKSQEPPAAAWIGALSSSRAEKRFLPQTIGHRGYRAVWPENTLAGFQAAVEVGAHAIETDLHLSSDGVVVLSHDASLKRCYGVDKKVNDCTWEYLSSLRTTREPHLPLPRLVDFLKWLLQPAYEKTWTLLDIKLDDKTEDLLGAVAEAIESVPTSGTPWEKRIVLGCWNATSIQVAEELFPDFPIVHISFSLPYSTYFRSVPNLGFNIYQRALPGLPGSLFLRDAAKRNRPVLVWTVNDERNMEWCIRKNVRSKTKCPPSSAGKTADEEEGCKIIDGVITDDPKLFIDVCERWEDEMDGKLPGPKPGFLAVLRTNLAFMVDSWGVNIGALGLCAIALARGRLDFFKTRRYKGVT